MRLAQGSTSVITGAGSGFGRALALELGRRGGRLVLSDVNLAGLKETVDRTRAVGAQEVKSLRCDVTQITDVEALSAACQWPVDLVVNNAGVSSAGPVGELPLEDWRWTIEVDLWGVIHGCHVFVPRLRKQARGHILNMASAAGLLCAPRMGAYNVAKAGVVALSETLAAELRGSGVGVTVLCPTFFKTEIATSGRFTDDKTRAMAERMVAGGKSVDYVVERALAAVESGDLYALPMADARWYWRLKRATPALFGRLTSVVAKLMR